MKLLRANLALAGPTVGSRGAETQGAGAGFAASGEVAWITCLDQTLGKPWENHGKMGIEMENHQVNMGDSRFQ